ncbi:hypothetical protein D3C77_651050 [compost metagenome]
MLIFDGNKFINCPKSRLIVSSNQFCADTPNIDFRSLCFQIHNCMFVQIICSVNFRAMEPCLIKHFTSFFREVGQIPAVETNPFKVDLISKFFRYLNGGRNARSKRIIRIH